MLKIDVTARTILATIQFARHSMPQDVRLSPDGKTFYVADMGLNGVHEIDGGAIFPDRLSCGRERARTDFTSAAIPRFCTSPTAAKEAFPCWT